MTRVSAIETRYAGCHMRSRLEARWAVFFDHLSLEWEYEPQGFELPSGRYLPDFRLLGDGGPFVEIKGGMPDTREFTVASEINLYVAPLTVFTGDIPRAVTGGSAWVFEEDAWRMVPPVDALVHVLCAATGDASHPGIITAVGMLAAGGLTAARSARFEHGESGGPR